MSVYTDYSCDTQYLLLIWVFLALAVLLIVLAGIMGHSLVKDWRALNKIAAQTPGQS